MTVVIAGGDELARAGCESLIDKELEVFKFDVSSDETSIDELIAQKTVKWVVLLSWSVDVEAVVRSCRNTGDPPPGMILVNGANTQESDPPLIRRGLDLGFNGILTADSDLSILNGILCMPPSDIVYISREIIDIAVSKNIGPSCGHAGSPEITSILSENTKLLDRIAKGWSNKEIARDAGLSEDRIKARVRQIMRILGVNKRTQLAATYLQLNLFSPSEDEDEDEDEIVSRSHEKISA